MLPPRVCCCSGECEIRSPEAKERRPTICYMCEGVPYAVCEVDAMCIVGCATRACVCGWLPSVAAATANVFSARRVAVLCERAEENWRWLRLEVLRFCRRYRVFPEAEPCLVQWSAPDECFHAAQQSARAMTEPSCFSHEHPCLFVHLIRSLLSVLRDSIVHLHVPHDYITWRASPRFYVLFACT